MHISPKSSPHISMQTHSSHSTMLSSAARLKFIEKYQLRASHLGTIDNEPIVAHTRTLGKLNLCDRCLAEFSSTPLISRSYADSRSDAA